MLNNFLHRPLGIVTVLTAAVGGPYAAFETDIGNSFRRSLANISAPAPNDPSRNTNAAPNALDPASLTGAYGTNPAILGGNSTVGWPANTPLPNSAPQLPNSAPQSMYSQNGQVVSTSYGPATVYALGPNGSPNGTMYSPNGYASPVQHAQPSQYSQANPSSQPSGNPAYVGYVAPTASAGPIMETRSGPSSPIPGSTDQLWDYTLGVPSLTQMQHHPQATVGGGAVTDLREVLRFDVTPGWLPQRFARVTTVTSDVRMDGLRVPLITGTQPNDIAGSLTYYFDASQSLKRINLHGITGDPTNLANLMVQFYQLRPEQSLGGQLFTSRWNNRVTSVMQIAPAPIIYAGAEHSKYIIFLELNQPSNQYGMSNEATEILRTAQAAQRW
ncbi:MAG: DUF6690 family protein [Pirellula sp.]